MVYNGIVSADRVCVIHACSLNLEFSPNTCLAIHTVSTHCCCLSYTSRRLLIDECNEIININAINIFEDSAIYTKSKNSEIIWGYLRKKCPYISGVPSWEGNEYLCPLKRGDNWFDKIWYTWYMYIYILCIKSLNYIFVNLSNINVFIKQTTCLTHVTCLI